MKNRCQSPARMKPEQRLFFCHQAVQAAPKLKSANEAKIMKGQYSTAKKVILLEMRLFYTLVS